MKTPPEETGDRGSIDGTVAVIVPCYNVEEHIGKALASVFVQDHRPLEVVAVDDGSADGTLRILQQWKAKSPVPMRVIAQPNKGACAARNSGMAASTSRFFQFLDADDALRPGKISRQVALALAHDADVIVGSYRNLDARGEPKEVVQPWKGDAWEGLIRTRLGTTSANLFKRQSVLQAGGWDEALRSSQDYELLFRMLKSGAMLVNDTECGCDVLKREHGAISRTDVVANWERYIEIRYAMREYARGLGSRAAELVAVADQYLFNAIRVLSAHDRRAGFDAFDRMMHKGFIPKADQATTSRYVQAFRLLGFRNAERLANWKKH